MNLFLKESALLPEVSIRIFLMEIDHDCRNYASVVPSHFLVYCIPHQLCVLTLIPFLLSHPDEILSKIPISTTWASLLLPVRSTATTRTTMFQNPRRGRFTFNSTEHLDCAKVSWTPTNPEFQPAEIILICVPMRLHALWLLNIPSAFLNWVELKMIFPIHCIADFSGLLACRILN